MYSTAVIAAGGYQPGGGPGADAAWTIVNWIAGLTLIALVAALVIAAVVGAMAQRRGYQGASEGAHSAVVNIGIAALIVGGAGALIVWFQGLGGGI